jgi:hypothetical protein
MGRHPKPFTTAVVQVAHDDGSFTPAIGHHSGAVRRVGKGAQGGAHADGTGRVGTLRFAHLAPPSGTAWSPPALRDWCIATRAFRNGAAAIPPNHPAKNFFSPDILTKCYCCNIGTLLSSNMVG